MKKISIKAKCQLGLSRLWSSAKRYYNQYLYPNRLVIVASLLTALCFFGIFVRPDWVTDSYAISSGLAHVNYGRDAVINGRPFSALFQYLTLGVFHLSMARATQISSALAIFEVGLAILVCYRLYSGIIRANNRSDQVVLWLLSVLTVINPMTVELFSFMERCVMMMGVLFAIAGAGRFARYLQKGERRDIILSAVYGIVSMLSYQGVYGTYLVLMALISLIASKGLRQTARAMVVAIILYVIPCIVGVAAIKFGVLVTGQTGRGASGVDLLKSAAIVLPQLKEIATFFDTIPPFVAPLICLVTLIGAITHSVAHRSAKGMLCWATGSIFLTFLSMCVAVAPLMMQRPDSIWISQRIVFPFGLILAAWLAWYFACYSEYINGGAMACCIFLLLSIELYKFDGFFTGRFEANAIDRYRAEWIIQQMSDYEEESHNIVNSVGFYYDKNVVRLDKDVMSTRDLNLSAFGTSWSDYSIINLYSGRYLIKAPKDQKYADYCAKRDWNTLDKSQVHFNGQVMNVCLY